MTALARVHHVGISVADLDRSIGFWEQLLGRSHRDRRMLEGPKLADLVGYPAVRIDSCWIDLPGNVELELLQYIEPAADPCDPGNAHPGNVHICIQVDDMDLAHDHAIGCGALPVHDAPISIGQGPRAGTRVAYLRDPDGVTIELLQPPR